MAGLGRSRTSKGLLLILSLYLVHVASSEIDKEKLVHDVLENLKKALVINIQKTTEAVNKMKVAYEKRVADASREHDERKKQLATIVEIVKEASDEFPPLVKVPNMVKRFCDIMKAETDRTIHAMAADLKENETQLQKQKQKAQKYVEL